MWIYEGGYERTNIRRIVGKRRNYLGLLECRTHCSMLVNMVSTF